MTSKRVALIRGLRDHPRMYLLSETFAEIIAWLHGHDLGAGEDFMGRFRTWLIERDGSRPELAVPTLVLREAFSGGVAVPTTRADNERANEGLFRLLEDYLDELDGPAPSESGDPIDG